MKIQVLILCVLLIQLGCNDQQNTQNETNAVGGMSGGSFAGMSVGGEMMTNGGSMMGGIHAGGAQDGGAQDGGAQDGGTNALAEVMLTIKALNPLNNLGVANLEATLVRGVFEPISSISNERGEVSFSMLANSFYEVTLDAEGYSTHHLFGELGTQPATQISFVSTDQLTSQVFSALNISPSSEKGIVVIGLDQPNLSPAVGASVELNANYEEAFTLGSFGPSRGREILSTSGGFVSFANVLAGDVEVLVQPKDGERCTVFPRNENSSFTITVYPGQVSIVAFTCQAE